MPRPRILLAVLFYTLVFSSCQLLQKSSDPTAGKEATPAEKPTVDIEVEDDIVVTPSKPYNPAETRRWDLIHTALRLEPIWKEEAMKGMAGLRLTPHFYPQDSLRLDAQYMDLHGIHRLAQGDTVAWKRYRYDSTHLTLYFDRALARGDTLQLLIDYTARPGRVSGGGGAAISDDRGLYFIDADSSDPRKPTQIWTQGQPEANSVWFPTIDAPNQKTTQEVRLTVDRRLQTLSNGELVYSVINDDGSRTDYWRMNQPHAPYLFMVAIGGFAVVEDRWRGKPLYYYVDSAYEEHARTVFGETPRMLDYFSNITGLEYPWPKYAQIVVEDFVSGAMENTTASVFYDALHQDARENRDNPQDGIIAHELFHHWFGDYVTCESWAQLALNESFATYGEILWWEHRYGHWEAEYYLHQDLQAYLQEASYNREEIINPYYRQPVELFDRHRYQKGGLVLHMLRNEVGNDAFFAALHRYLKAQAFGTAEIAQLRIAFEETTGRDLQWFFDQWFHQAGHPEIIVQQQYDSTYRELTLGFYQYQNRELYPVFELPMQPEIHLADTVLRPQIRLQNRRDTFRFELPSRPLWVNLDPQHQFLATFSEVKSNAERRYQLRRGGHYLDKLQAINTLVSRAKEIPKDTLVALTRFLVSHPAGRVRSLGIRAVRDLARDSVYLESLSDTLRHLMVRDEKPYNRRLAIMALEALDPADLAAALELATEDSSYTTAAQALRSLLEIDTAAALSKARQLKGFEQEEIRQAVCMVFIETRAEDQRAFLRRSMETLPINSAGEVVFGYFDYLKGLGDETLLEALQQWDQNLGFLLQREIIHYIVRGKLRQLKSQYQETLNSNAPEQQKALAEQLVVRIEALLERPTP